MKEMTYNKKSFYKFVIKDFDARIVMAEEAEYRIGRFKSGLWNDNGNRLVGLLSAARLFHGYIFMKKDERRWTHRSRPMATYAKIGHILTSKGGACWMFQ